MKAGAPKPVILLPLAEQDVKQATVQYHDKAGDALALRFVQSFLNALRFIGEQPGAGSPRYASLLNLPSLRFWQMNKFPYLVFYIERETQLDVWRVLHRQRDIPAWLVDPAGQGEQAAQGGEEA